MHKMIKKILITAFVYFSSVSLFASSMLLSNMLVAPFGASLPYIAGTTALKTVNTNTLNNAKGNIGEEMTNIGYLDRLKNTGWQIIPPRDGRPQGLDHFALKFREDGVLEDVLVVETKFTKKDGFAALGHPLDGVQMSREWVEPRVANDIVSKYNAFITDDRKGLVRIVSELPKDETVELFPIDNNSYYFRDKNGTPCFYSTNDKYTYSDGRISRCENTCSSLMRQIRDGKFRRVIVHYEIKEKNIIRTEIILGDGDAGTTSVKKIRRESSIIPLSEYDKLFDSDDYKQFIKATYGLADLSFFDDPGFDNSMKLKLVSGIDSETANKVFSSHANRAALSRKFNLNPAIDYRNLKLSDKDWQKVLRTDDLYNLPDNLVVKLRSASRKATVLGGVTSGVSAGALAGITNILSQGIQSGFDNIDWKTAAYSTGMGISIGVLNTAGEAASRALLRVGSSRATKGISSFILRGAGVAVPFFLDTLVDVGFGIYNLYNGTYISGWQAAADIAVNAGVNFGIVGLAAIAGTTIGGPAGTIVGIVGGGLWAFGSYYVINPITSSIERHTIFDILESNEREQQIKIWTANALGIQAESI